MKNAPRTYTSEYMYERARFMLRRKGYIVVSESRFGGLITVVYGKKK